MSIIRLVVLFTFLTFKIAIAQPAVENTAGENPSSEKEPSLKIGGYFDTYFFTNLNKPTSRNNLGSSGISRGFDRYVDQFQLGMFMMSFRYSNKLAELVTEVGYGPNMEYASYGSDFRYKWGTALANSTYTAIMIKQAYINFKASEKLTFAAGQFGTHIGYEYIDAPLNFHYSINNTFNAGTPFYHLGLKATYLPNDHMSFMAGVVNGTDNINDNNRSKSLIGQFMITPAEGLTFYLNTIQGNEANQRISGKDTTSYFGLLDFITTYQVNEKLLLSVWGIYGSAKGEFQGGNYSSEMKHWSGVNLYILYKFNDLLSVGTRVEYFDNKSGARALLTQGVGTEVKTFTLTANINLIEGLVLKPEFRADVFKKVSGVANEENSQQFMDNEGNFSRNSQSTLGMAAVFKF